MGFGEVCGGWVLGEWGFKETWGVRVRWESKYWNGVQRVYFWVYLVNGV